MYTSVPTCEQKHVKRQSIITPRCKYETGHVIFMYFFQLALRALTRTLC